jgi:flagellar protein FliS
MSAKPEMNYLQMAASGASPVGRIILLYDTILRDFARAQAALKAGNVEARISELNHALTVIAHLQSVLDFERGGEAAKHFERFYDVTRALIVEANIKASPESLENLIKLFSGVRQAWQQAEERLDLNQPQPPSTARAAETVEPQAARLATSEVEMPQLNWSA